MSLVVFHDDNISTDLDVIKINEYIILGIKKVETFLNVFPLGKLQVYPPVSSKRAYKNESAIRSN